MRCHLFGFIAPFIPYVSRHRGVGLRAGYRIKLDQGGILRSSKFLILVRAGENAGKTKSGVIILRELTQGS